jgi:hypothetical protein
MSPGFLAGNEILAMYDRLVKILLQNFLQNRNYSFIINNYSSPLWFHHQFCVAKMLLMNIELQRIAKRWRRQRVYLWVIKVLEF